MKRELIKNMYIKEDKSIEDICTALSITRGTFYYHKNEDAKKGIDWDELKLIQAYDKKPTLENEKVFLSTLINEFEKALEEFKTENAEGKLKKLERFAASYYRLKMPQGKIASSVKKIDVLQEFLKKLVDIAVEQNHIEVANFLSQNADKIVNDLLKSE